jgi:hypothetical protein
MRDNLRRYRAIRAALIQYYPGEPTGTATRHLTTLAALISGMVASKSTQLPKIATHVPDRRKPESLAKRFARWIRIGHITDAVNFVPYVDLLLRHLVVETLVFVIDGSVVRRGCVALMLHMAYKGRVPPLAWQVRQRAKGHFPEDLHIALVKQVHDLILPGAPVALQGDGEFDGIRLQEQTSRLPAKRDTSSGTRSRRIHLAQCRHHLAREPFHGCRGGLAGDAGK